MRKYFIFLLIISLFGTTACSSLKKKNETATRPSIPLDGIAKYLAYPKPEPVLLLLRENIAVTQDLLHRGYNLLLVVDEANHTAFRANFSEYTDAQLRLTDIMQGKIGAEIPYSGIIMDESRLGRPIGIAQNRLLIDILWSRLEKGATFFYFNYTEEADQYGIKASSFKTSEIIDLVQSKFSQYQVDSTIIPGFHVIKFTK